MTRHIYPEHVPPNVPQELLDLRQELIQRLPWAASAGPSDIAPGWARIVDRLDRDLTKIAPGYKLGQIKEKLGGLRYYIDGPLDEVGQRAQGLIENAEDDSFHTCDYCGEPGELKKIGWVYCTRCDRHVEPEDSVPVPGASSK